MINSMWTRIMGLIMIGVGIMIIGASLEAAPIVAYQIMILGSMFFGLGVVVISIGTLNSSIRELLGNSFSVSNGDSPQPPQPTKPKDSFKPSAKLTTDDDISTEELEKKIREHVTDT